MNKAANCLTPALFLVTIIVIIVVVVIIMISSSTWAGRGGKRSVTHDVSGYRM